VIRGITRTGVFVACALLPALFAAPLARADDTQIKISEVYSDGMIGATPADQQDFVELQLAAPGQQIAGGDILRLYNPTGTAQINFAFPPNPTNLADSQRTILFGWNTNPAVDFAAAAKITPLPIGGAWCLLHSDQTVIDCVSWGNFTGSVPTAGPPFPEPLNASQSLTRKITAGCPTLLDAPDDTDNSSADFAMAGLTPQNNLALPSQIACLPPPTSSPTCKKKKKHHKGRIAETAKKKRKKCKKHHHHRH
jgi:hypothetical protein